MNRRDEKKKAWEDWHIEFNSAIKEEIDRLASEKFESMSQDELDNMGFFYDSASDQQRLRLFLFSKKTEAERYCDLEKILEEEIAENATNTNHLGYILARLEAMSAILRNHLGT
jgi:hypothetical protein